MVDPDATGTSAPNYDDELPDYDSVELAAAATERLIDDEIDMENYDSDKSSGLQDEGLDMKRQVLRWFAALGFGIMAVLYACLAGTVVGSNEEMIYKTKLELIEQVDRQAYSTLDEAGQYLTRLLNQYDEAVISYTAFSINNALRVSPQFDQAQNISNYWDDEVGLSGLCQPTAVDPPRFPTEQVSLCASAAFLTSHDSADLNTISGADSPLNNGIDAVEKTTVLDPFLRHMYETNPDLYIIYAGFDTKPPLTRRYPGRATQVTYNATSYNPTLRGWYNESINNAANTTIYTAPYQDYHTGDWMITGARTFYQYDLMSGYYPSSTGSTDVNNPDPYAATPLGVVGADVLITTLADALNDIKFLSSGKLSLIRSDGQVVADRDWNITTATSEFYYYNLLTPAVSFELWNNIVGTPAGSTKMIEHGDLGESDEHERIAYVKHLSDYDGQFYLVVFIATEEVYSPVQEAIEELQSINSAVLSALAIGLGLMGVVLVLFMWYLLNAIMKVFHDIEGNVEQLLRNVGQSDRKLGDNMVEIDSGASSELTQLSASMNEMVHNLQANRGTRSIEVSQEGGEQITLHSMWNLVPMGQSADAGAADLPMAVPVTPRGTL